MKITRVETHVLVDPNYRVGATSSAQDDLVVEIFTDEGVSGIGEVDVNPWMARACIEAPGTHTMGQGLTEMLLGSDPLDIEGLHERLYVGSAMNGRRGLVIHAIGAIDMALYDLKGKALGVPVYELLGGARQDTVVPYASLQPEVGDFNRYKASMREWAVAALKRGFRAAKVECTLDGPYRHMGLRESMHRATEVLWEVRDAVGPDFTLMVDVQYAFSGADACLAVIRAWEPLQLFFLETPLPADDLDGYARLSESQPIPIAAGEWLATRFEFLDLMDRGRVAVVQPDLGRVGGLTEARRVAALAGDRGRLVVPHAWKTGISIAAARHFAAAVPHCPYIEFLPRDLSESPIRRDLVPDELVLQDGRLPLPKGPGLGASIDRDALARFEEVARKLY
jgi:L-alanine-DL-glutamate epimerase-like enolase superfamily enzyme